jgi:hypothetical protein
MASRPWFMTRGIFLMLALGAACGRKSARSDESSGGGKSSSGGSGSISFSDCGPFVACGGDVVGTWTLASLCGDSIMSVARLGPDCAVIEGTPTLESDASYAFDSDGTYIVSGTIDLSATESFDDACTTSTFQRSASEVCTRFNDQNSLVGSAGFSLKCTFGNGTCTCHASAPLSENETGTYAVDGTSITLTPSSSGAPNATTTSSLLAGTSDFCSDGNTLTVRASDGTIATLAK